MTINLKKECFFCKFMYFIILITVFLFALIFKPDKVYADFEANELFKLMLSVDDSQVIERTVAGADISLDTIELDYKTDVTGVSVNGQITLNSKNSFARIILIDDQFNEYLIFESYDLLSSKKTIVLKNSCEETAMLDYINVDSIRIEVNDALVIIDKIDFSFSETLSEDARYTDFKSLRNQQIMVKIEKINKHLLKKNMNWIAGETSIGNLTYAEKKKLFGGTLPNLYGFEYYKGGIFEIPSSGDQSEEVEVTGSSPFVSEFTWENRHSKNWITPVKRQIANSCWAFSTASAVEMTVNLYYNQLLNMNLSEQALVSCANAGTAAKGGYPTKALDYIIKYGIVDEKCFPFTGKDDPCNICSNPDEIIKVESRTDFNRNTHDLDDLKKMAIKGPISFALRNWRHAITLVGYKTIKAGDRIHYPSKVIKVSDPLIGKTAWRIKNSWGTTWGEKGYGYVTTTASNLYYTYLVNGPVVSKNYNKNDIKCTDNDNDGYYYWGYGSKPAHCPSSPSEPDGDDSNAMYGPMDEYGNLTILDNVKADFTYDKDSLLLKFKDTSSGDIVSWEWDFGNNETSDIQNPEHAYAQSGTYDVKLTVTDKDGKTDSKSVEITVTDEQHKYCASKSENISYFWISKVRIGDFVINSNASYYSDFTSREITMEKGKSYPLNIGCGGQTKYRNWYTVWVDLNYDGDFNDPGERLFQTEEAITGSVSNINITIPKSVTAVGTRMRVTQKNINYSDPSDPCDMFKYGEVEDYTVIISGQ